MRQASIYRNFETRQIESGGIAWHEEFDELWRGSAGKNLIDEDALGAVRFYGSRVWGSIPQYPILIKLRIDPRAFALRPVNALEATDDQCQQSDFPSGRFVERQQAYISHIGQSSKKLNIQSSTMTSCPAIVACEKNMSSAEYA